VKGEKEEEEGEGRGKRRGKGRKRKGEEKKRREEEEEKRGEVQRKGMRWMTREREHSPQTSLAFLSVFNISSTSFKAIF
jgi:hypothetical protein